MSKCPSKAWINPGDLKNELDKPVRTTGKKILHGTRSRQIKKTFILLGEFQNGLDDAE